MHSSFGVSHTSFQQRSTNTFGLYLPVYFFFPFGIYPYGTFHRARQRRLPYFLRKKIQVGLQEMEFQQHVAPQGTM